MSPEEAARRVQSGEHFGNGPFKIPAAAREVICYFKGPSGEEVSAWHHGRQIATATIQRYDGAEWGYAAFPKPDDATHITMDHELNRAVFT